MSVYCDSGTMGCEYCVAVLCGHVFLVPTGWTEVLAVYVPVEYGTGDGACG